MDAKHIPKEIEEYLEYSYVTGQLIWIKKLQYSSNRVGDIAGTINKGGYLQLTFKTKIYLIHRIIWFLVKKEQPKTMLDHIDGNKLNNFIWNLRNANKYTNQYNQGKSKKNTSGFKGVSWNKLANKWKVTIRSNGCRVHLGYFSNINDAAKAYSNAATELHKDFKKL